MSTTIEQRDRRRRKIAAQPGLATAIMSRAWTSLSAREVPGSGIPPADQAWKTVVERAHNAVKWKESKHHNGV